MLFADDGTRIAPPPRRVAILGMGPTLQDFTFLKLTNPGPKSFVDEVWGMNNVCTAIACDVGLIMDDFVEMLERPYMGNKEKGIPAAIFWDKTNSELMQWAREECKIPLITSKAHKKRYPTTINYPLDAVLKSVFGEREGFHFSNTTSYAIALAWHLGVQEIHLFGCDFGYPWHDPYDRRRILEASRGNVESLLMAGYMLGKFTFHLSARSSLFDTMEQRPFYGYADGRKAFTDSMLLDKTQHAEKVENDQRVAPDYSGPQPVDGTKLAAGAAAGNGSPAQLAHQPDSAAAANTGVDGAGGGGGSSSDSGTTVVVHTGVDPGPT